jgi:hypothetical protein
MPHSTSKRLMLICALAAVVWAGACSRQEPTGPATTTTPTPKPAAGPTAPAPKPTSTAAKTLAKAIAGVKPPKSFEVDISENGEHEATVLVKGDWKIVRIIEPTGWGQMDQTKRVMYIYDEAQNAVVKRKLPPEMQAGGAELAVDPLDEWDPEVPITGEEEIDGTKCWTAESTRRFGSESDTGTLWVRQDYGLLRRVQSGDVTRDAKYTRVNELTDADFALPKGAAVHDLTAPATPAPRPKP